MMAIIHKVAFLRMEVLVLRKANKELSKRWKAKKTYMRLRGSLIV